MDSVEQGGWIRRLAFVTSLAVFLAIVLVALARRFRPAFPDQGDAAAIPPTPRSSEAASAGAPTLAQSAHRRSLTSVSRFVRSYAWALPALAIIFALQLNTHLYYNLFLGFDMPQHFNNTYAVMTTGTMPPPPFTGPTYQAHQAPLYYILTAWVMLLGNQFTADAMQQVMPFALLIVAMLWVLLVTAFIQRAMRRVYWLWRTLALTLVMLTPMNVEASVMFSNDLPLIALGAFGVMILWFMARSGRYLERKYWLRAAAIIGLAMAFKNNATIPMGTYIVLAGYIAWMRIREQRRDLALRVLRYALLGLPLMLAPFAVNAWHTLRYTSNLVSVQTPPSSFFDNTDLRYLISFDTTVFQNPFSRSIGNNSFWAAQYVTLHNDYYRFWGSAAYKSWPASAMMPMLSADDLLPIERFNTAVILQYVAIPITLVMLFAVAYALYRVIRSPRSALRDGSIVVVAVTVISEVAQFLKVWSFADVRWFLIPSRHLGFLFPILFVVGILYLWKLVLRRRSLVSDILSVFLCLNIVAYSFLAFKLMWLPATF